MTGQGNKMELLDKAQIIIEFTEEFYNDEDYLEFFEYNDLGVPMAVMFRNNLITLTQDGINLLEETWSDLCNLFEANPNEDYESLEDLIS